MSRRPPEMLESDVRSAELAKALGSALKDAREVAGLTQAEVGARCALAQTAISRMERGGADSWSLRSWVRVADATGTTLQAYLSGASTADQPKDAVHLRTQELVANIALSGGWASVPERAVDDAARGSRSVDLWLERRAADHVLEVVAIEVMDWFDDVGARFRDWDRRLERVCQLAVGTRSREGPDGVALPRVSGCWVVRATQRNRGILADHRTLFRARFPGDPDAWLRTLGGPGQLPSDPAILWVDVKGTRLFARARQRPRPTTSERRRSATAGTRPGG
ncbi:MAG: helix-turn-helix transcriptional regulator [Chloroflexi bacterium]|nr:helix-turn-helix transcriptional regulator [Chloroflexota bacterium]